MKWVALGAASVLFGPVGQAHASDTPTALDRYVAAPDAHYRYEQVNTVKGDGYTVWFLDMVSQTWRTTDEVDRVEWRHWVIIVQPDTVEHETGLLFVGGGRNDRPAPENADDKLIEIARQTRSVVAEVRMIPNQPLVFAGETRERFEDSLIAYTWDKFLRGGDENWPARLPMTKAVVRAMDTITDFCAREEAGGVKVNRFVVAGGSKRGWTTWTTAAVDERVTAIIPIVIDLLNVEPSFRHHFRAYGFYAPAVRDYEEMGIMNWQGTPEYAALRELVEPYEYRERFTMPKFIINATGDQFFLPDSSQFYFDDLPGVKYLRYVPNADHSLKDTDAVHTILACYHAVLNGTRLPRFEWRMGPDGSLTVTSEDSPESARLWQAVNPDARDFRLETIGAVWKETLLEADQTNPHVYSATVPEPEKGWRAYFIELTYAHPGGPAPFKFTTGVQVSPQTLPHEFKTSSGR
jgi:PhoPQ-activated pathogenicity-related protein